MTESWLKTTTHNHGLSNHTSTKCDYKTALNVFGLYVYDLNIRGGGGASQLKAMRGGRSRGQFPGCRRNGDEERAKKLKKDCRPMKLL